VWKLGRSETLGLLPVSSLWSVLPVSPVPTVKLFPVCLAAGLTGSAVAELGVMQHGTSLVSSRMTSFPAAVNDNVGVTCWMLRNSSFSVRNNRTFLNVSLLFPNAFVRSYEFF